MVKTILKAPAELKVSNKMLKKVSKHKNILNFKS